MSSTSTSTQNLHAFRKNTYRFNKVTDEIKVGRTVTEHSRSPGFSSVAQLKVFLPHSIRTDQAFIYTSLVD